LLAGFATFEEATRSAAHDRVTADAIAVSEDGTGLADASVAALAAEPGVTAAVPVTDTPVYVRDDDQPEEWTGRYAHGPDLAEVLDLPLADGDLADLTGDDTIAVPAGRWKLGETAELWLGDATPVRLRVVAVLADQLDLADVALLPRALRTAHAQPLADSVYLALAPDASRTAVAAAVETTGGSVIRTEDHLLAADAEQDRTDRLAMIAVLGLALLYTGISIANTLAMTIGDRAREFAALRLTGATGRQILRMVGVEATVVTCTGVLLAAAVTATTVLLTRTGIGDRAPSVPLVIPWQPLGAIAGACLATALLAGLIQAALLLRRRPASLIS
jgi:putative ABC transport system permease protein